LFQPFQQVNAATTRRYGGTGLGLAITQRIATLMGGEAGVESVVGSGSTFWFTAWLGRGQPHDAIENTRNQASAEQQLRQRHEGVRVLLAEDNEVNQEVAIALLSRTGIKVDLAVNGREAVAKAATGDYAAILMDIHMPEMDGLEATRHIRALPDRADVPIIAMTADAFDDDRGRCAAAGMNDFIGKPVAPLELYGTLLRWLERRSGAHADVESQAET
jgi:CheY-like chemotaxis protein